MALWAHGKRDEMPCYGQPKMICATLYLANAGWARHYQGGIWRTIVPYDFFMMLLAVMLMQWFGNLRYALFIASRSLNVTHLNRRFTNIYCFFVTNKKLTDICTWIRYDPDPLLLTRTLDHNFLYITEHEL